MASWKRRVESWLLFVVDRLDNTLWYDEMIAQPMATFRLTIHSRRKNPKRHNRPGPIEQARHPSTSEYRHSFRFWRVPSNSLYRE